MLTPDEFNAWLEHPVTKLVRECMRKRRADIAELMLAGRFTHEDPGATAQDTAAAIGECSGLRFAAELDFETYESEMTNGESQRINPQGGSGTDQNA